MVSRVRILKQAENFVKNVGCVNIPDRGCSSLHSKALLQLISALCRRIWCPRWRRCARQFWRASTSPALLHLPLPFHLLPSCPQPWCRLSTLCLRSTRLVQWVAYPHTITHITHTTLLSTDPEPFQVCWLQLQPFLYHCLALFESDNRSIFECADIFQHYQ